MHLNFHSPAGSPIDKASNCLSALEFLLGSHMKRELICCNETERQCDRITFGSMIYQKTHFFITFNTGQTCFEVAFFKTKLHLLLSQNVQDKKLMTNSLFSNLDNFNVFVGLH